MAAASVKVRQEMLRECYNVTLRKLIDGEIVLTSAHKVGMAGLCIFIFGIVVQTNIFPSFLESKVQKEVALEKGTLRRENWSKLPFPCELRAYMFNVTNPKEIHEGAKPILREIGPFVYDIWQEKTNEIDDDENDTVTYSINNTYYFNIEKSNNISDNIELILADFLTMSTPNAVMKDQPTILPMAAKAVDSLGKNPTSLFLKQTAKKFLFDGQGGSCEGINDFFGIAYCKDIQEYYLKYRVVKKPEDVYVYSIFGALNETDIYHGKTRIRRGMRNIMEIGNVVEYNDLKNISVWKNDECDKFRGTEGTMFAPFLLYKKKKKKQDLYVTSTFYCRSLVYKYESQVKYKGLKLLRYTTSVGADTATNEKDKCYCIAANRCLKNGVFEIWRCFNNPFILSNPHFFKADPTYADGIEGVNPSKDDHMIVLDVDPLTGLVVRSHFRVQYNMQLIKLEKYRLMRNVHDALLPLLWIDEVMILPDLIVKRIKHIYWMIIIAKVISYLLIFVGLAMCGYALFCEIKSRKE